MIWKIVRKSNFAKELFEEVFIEPLHFVAHSAATEVADVLNSLLVCDSSEYIYEVVDGDYQLYNGFEGLL